jgi:hypothetical protein
MFILNLNMQFSFKKKITFPVSIGKKLDDSWFLREYSPNCTYLYLFYWEINEDGEYGEQDGDG